MPKIESADQATEVAVTFPLETPIDCTVISMSQISPEKWFLDSEERVRRGVAKLLGMIPREDMEP